MFFLPAGGAAAADGATTQVVRRDLQLMGTFVEISVFIDDGRTTAAEKAIDGARDEMQALVDLVSSWDPKSQTSRLNAQAGVAPVRVGPRLMEILRFAKRVAAESDGAFDVTVSPVARLYKLQDINPVIPDAAALAEGLKRVGSQHLALDAKAGTAFLRRKGMRVDLGAVAKGAVVDAGARSLRRAGYPNALINAGGDLCALGGKGGQPWMVGVRNPRAPRGTLMGTLALRDRAIATSGDYEKYVEVDGKLYHHLLDARTGRPARGCVGVTVVAPTAQAADAYATAFFALGPEAGKALCEKLKDLEAMFVTPDLRVVRTSGFTPENFQ